MNRIIWIFIGLSGFIAVFMGAAAAHWLSNVVNPEDLSRIEKASYYQIVHTLALLAIALLIEKKQKLNLSAYSFMVGIILFSGSLYLYSFIHIKTLVYITPLGGLAFMVGWLSLCRKSLKR